MRYLPLIVLLAGCAAPSEDRDLLACGIPENMGREVDRAIAYAAERMDNPQIPDQRPAVAFVYGLDGLAVRRGAPRNLEVHGVYDWSQGVAAFPLDYDVNDPYDRSVAIHEACHYLQGPPTFCLNDRERQCHAMQRDYLAERGIWYDWAWVERTYPPCGTSAR